MQYHRDAREQAALRRAIDAIVDRWVLGEFGYGTPAVERKRELVAEEVAFYAGRPRKTPELPDEEQFWWNRESA
jgi:hypothetical protein